jgi:hypothetical protein
VLPVSNCRSQPRTSFRFSSTQGMPGAKERGDYRMSRPPGLDSSRKMAVKAGTARMVQAAPLFR